jgi:hypothetical protein
VYSTPVPSAAACVVAVVLLARVCRVLQDNLAYS